MAGLEIEEGNHEVKSKDLTAAVFLLGGVTFVMSLFYFVSLDLLQRRLSFAVFA